MHRIGIRDKQKLKSTNNSVGKLSSVNLLWQAGQVEWLNTLIFSRDFCQQTILNCRVSIIHAAAVYILPRKFYFDILTFSRDVWVIVQIWMLPRVNIVWLKCPFGCEPTQSRAKSHLTNYFAWLEFMQIEYHLSTQKVEVQHMCTERKGKHKLVLHHFIWSAFEKQTSLLKFWN